MVGTQTASAESPERLMRRLTGILVADVVGSTRMMEQDEVGTLAAMHAFMTEIAASTVAKYHGNVIKTTGDGAVVEFSSPVEAVICAFETQRRLCEWVSPNPAHGISPCGSASTWVTSSAVPTGISMEMA
jgi:adenylate cyclase